MQITILPPPKAHSLVLFSICKVHPSTLRALPQGGFLHKSERGHTGGYLCSVPFLPKSWREDGREGERIKKKKGRKKGKGKGRGEGREFGRGQKGRRKGSSSAVSYQPQVFLSHYVLSAADKAKYKTRPLCSSRFQST